MSNIEYIRNNLQNNSFILKSVLRMDDIHSINIKYIEHFIQILKTSKDKLKKFKLAYNNYNKFIDLYTTMLEISGEAAVDLGFCTLSAPDKINFLKTNNIKYELIKEIIVVYPSSFEEGQMIYPKAWCIKKSKILWKRYNDHSKHMVLYRGNKIYGISHNNTKFQCYSKNDISIKYYEFVRQIGKELPFKFKTSFQIKKQNLVKKYNKELWIILTIDLIYLAVFSMLQMEGLSTIHNLLIKLCIIYTLTITGFNVVIAIRAGFDKFFESIILFAIIGILNGYIQNLDYETEKTPAFTIYTPNLKEDMIDLDKEIDKTNKAMNTLIKELNELNADMLNRTKDLNKQIIQNGEIYE